MSTGGLDRLERVERLLENALHEADQVPVDYRAGRAALVPRLDQRQRSVRRRTVIAVAASVLATILTTSIVVAGLGEDKESLPAAPAPGITFSPSGLPVGLLQGKVERTEPGAKSTIRIVVRPDGTGTWNAGTTGAGTGDSVADYPVRLDRTGPGRADIVSTDDGLFCNTSKFLTLEFTVRGRTVVIEDTITGGCVVDGGLASDMTGTTLRIQPLPPGT